MKKGHRRYKSECLNQNFISGLNETLKTPKISRPITNINTARSTLDCTNYDISVKTSKHIKIEQNSGDEVPPEIAAKVVKNYLLPMFEYENRKQNRLLINKTFGIDKSFNTTQSKFKADKNTTYGELKLSEELLNEIKSLKSQLKTAKKNESDALQEKIKYEREYERLKSLNLDNQVIIKSLNFEVEVLTKQIQAHQAEFGLSIIQIEKYKDLVDSLESQVYKLTKELHDEKANNDKYKNLAIQLENNGLVAEMECAIIGEQLKGLYFAINSLGNMKSNEFGLFAEFELFTRNSRKLADFILQIERDIQWELKDKDQLIKDLIEIKEAKESLVTNRDKIYKAFKEKVITLENDLNSNVKLREELKQEVEELKKKLSALTEEYNNLKQRLKQYRSSRSNISDERFCKNCQKLYLESKNFNWSCRMHSSIYSGEVYWCCGNTNKDSLGCISTKHVSKDDVNEEEHKLNFIRCSSCKDYGHSVHECPRDPNARTVEVPEEELTRIIEISQNKRKMNPGLMIDCKTKKLLKDKQFEESPAWSVGDDNKKEIAFHDVQEVREQVSFTSETNRVQFEEVELKEKSPTRLSILASAIAKSKQSSVLIVPMRVKTEKKSFTSLIQDAAKIRRHSTVPEMPISPTSS
ncbi:unnamed protein product [Blepharisma stoltei]|uniref:CCHC-type domain-containing protein n=1 Tax=Blepharisma stoltei TaxID=1481888 RepID=A0AAU9KGT7_9CILI|nr:unnamed protein product [Blepharisma stoltei]